MAEMHEQPASSHSLDLHDGHENHQSSAQAPPTSVEPVAPQNAQAAGASTEEQHALLQDNVSGSEQEGAHEKANRLANENAGGNPGYHSTGSFTGASGGQK